MASSRQLALIHQIARIRNKKAAPKRGLSIEPVEGLAIAATLRSTRARTTPTAAATPATRTTLLSTRPTITLRTLAALIANRSIHPIEIRLLGNILTVFVEVLIIFALQTPRPLRRVHAMHQNQRPVHQLQPVQDPANQASRAAHGEQPSSRA